MRYGDYDKPETLAEAVKGAEKMLLISGTRVGARVDPAQGRNRRSGGRRCDAHPLHQLHRHR